MYPGFSPVSWCSQEEGLSGPIPNSMRRGITSAGHSRLVMLWSVPLLAPLSPYNPEVPHKGASGLPGSGRGSTLPVAPFHVPLDLIQIPDDDQHPVWWL